MADSELVLLGFELMLFGMGFVFVFLALLVLSTSGMSRVVNRFWPEQEVAAPAAAPAAAARPDQDAELLAVISAAIHQYRARHRK